MTLNREEQILIINSAEEIRRTLIRGLLVKHEKLSNSEKEGTTKELVKLTKYITRLIKNKEYQFSYLWTKKE